MRLALAFGRPDVDQFIDEIDHDQVVQWNNYLTSVAPIGWEATAIATQRLSFMIAQAQSSKPVKYETHAINLKSNIPRSPEAEAMHWRAVAIRSAAEERHRKRVAEKRAALRKAREDAKAATPKRNRPRKRGK